MAEKWRPRHAVLKTKKQTEKNLLYINCSCYILITGSTKSARHTMYLKLIHWLNMKQNLTERDVGWLLQKL